MSKLLFIKSLKDAAGELVFDFKGNGLNWRATEGIKVIDGAGNLGPNDKGHAAYIEDGRRVIMVREGESSTYSFGNKNENFGRIIHESVDPGRRK